ncbi:hypothetical protein BJ138DRAFT_1119067 [Hygrophoropsis aurantiaca]|uniref:Uncharacterized protein n=1 Tax=Hygrophoropsis aurantiaca TaxID=72124 RepID=A0ACB7ZVS5_9AGAM|nr:hypothetical protein BJ138DRAFT_1119067 [Hygrophoropsis aurantiaca]
MSQSSSHISRVQGAQSFSFSSQFPCGFPGCQRVLKTTGGRTKHRQTAHPALATQVHKSTDGGAPGNGCMPQDEASEDADMEIEEIEQEPDDTAHNDQFNNPGRNSHTPPIPDIDTEFYGAGDKLYRNYHTRLNANPYTALTGTVLARVCIFNTVPAPATPVTPIPAVCT